MPIKIDVGATVLAVQRLNVGCYNIYRYTAQFGLVRDSAPFGDNVWHGMSMLFNELMRQRAHRSSPSRFGAPGPWAAAWFTPPSPFSRANAMLNVDAYSDEPYPAFVYVDVDGTIYMWCLSILIQFSRWWVVHPSRIQIVAWYPNGQLSIQDNANSGGAP